MKLNTRRTSLSVTILTFLLFTSSSFGQKPSVPNDAGALDPVAVKTDLYPADTDAKKEIDEALKLAVAERKRVLLIFGANWCYDCHVLDRALHDGAAGQVVKESFLLVPVDIGEGEKNPEVVKQYQIKLDKGVPVIAILASDGKLLYGSNDGEFEAARRMMKRDLVAFLKRWRESPLPNPQRTVAPARSARVARWMRPDPRRQLSVAPARSRFCKTVLE